MSDLIKQQFDAVAKNYDNERRQLIPCFDDFYGTAAHWIKTSRQAPRILDLGAGTGLFSSYARHKFPKAELTLIDFSEEMLKGARVRFANDPLIHYAVADYVDYEYKEQYDAVISSLSIHHLSHDNKRKLFRIVYDLLPSGGVFINADQAAASSAYFDQLYKEEWESTVGQSGLAREAIEASIERRKQDLNATVDDQLQWLQDAGFRYTENVYKYNEFAVFFSQKS